MNSTLEAEVSRVFPSYPRPAAPITTHLSILDATVARFTSTGAIWLFDPPKTANDALLAHLSASFILTLNDYPQWAGQLQWAPSPPSLPGRPMLVHGSPDDPGVLWQVVSNPLRISDLVPEPSVRAANATHGIWDATSFPQADLVPSVQLALSNLKDFAGMPGMAVQITTFACSGFAVAVKMAHPLADAQSLLGFMHRWAANGRALHLGAPAELGEPPVFDPALLDGAAAGDISKTGDPDLTLLEASRALPVHRFDWWGTDQSSYPSFLKPTTENSRLMGRDLYNSKSQKSRSQLKELPWHEWDLAAPVGHRQIHFTTSQLEALKRAARGIPGARSDVSKLDSLLAHVWVLIMSARSHMTKDVNVKHRPAYLNITLGARSRAQPPLPQSFVGSPLFLAHVRCPLGEYSDNPGLLPSKIRDTVSLFTPEKVGVLLYDLAHEPVPQRVWGAFLGSQHTIVTSWLRLGVYDIDFIGGAKPRYVQAIMPKMDGCVQVMESANSDGMDVSLYLEETAMVRFVELRREIAGGLIHTTE